jgi:hypothetical protein
MLFQGYARDHGLTRRREAAKASVAFFGYDLVIHRLNHHAANINHKDHKGRTKCIFSDHVIENILRFAFGFYVRTINITITIFTTKAQRRQTQMALTIRKCPQAGRCGSASTRAWPGGARFMEELLAELERRRVRVEAMEIGADGRARKTE